MATFHSDLALKEISDEEWEVIKPLKYSGKSDTFTVPSEFRTDLASVPRALTWFVPRYGRYTKAAVLHDFLCRNPDQASREDADGIFRRTMRELDVSILRRWIMWAAVRLGNPKALLRSGPVQVLLVLAWAIPALAFLLVPTLVVAVWLTAAYLLEGVVFVLQWIARKQPNTPSWGIKG